MSDINLSNFERLAIIRDELDARMKDLKQLERRIGDIRQTLQRRKFLWAICPEYYKGQPPPEGAKDLQSLEQEKARLDRVVAQLRNAQAQIEAAVAGAASPQQPPQAAQSPAPPGVQRRHRLASFD